MLANYFSVLELRETPSPPKPLEGMRKRHLEKHSTRGPCSCSGRCPRHSLRVACVNMKPYEHISILLTWEGNRTRVDACGAATGAAKHLFLGVLLPQCWLYTFLNTLTCGRVSVGETGAVFLRSRSFVQVQDSLNKWASQLDFCRYSASPIAIITHCVVTHCLMVIFRLHTCSLIQIPSVSTNTKRHTITRNK